MKRVSIAAIAEKARVCVETVDRTIKLFAKHLSEHWMPKQPILAQRSNLIMRFNVDPRILAPPHGNRPL